MYNYSDDKRFWEGYKAYKLKHKVKDDSMLNYYKALYHMKLLRELGKNNGIGYNVKYDDKVEMG